MLCWGLMTKGFFTRTVKTLIRPGGCPGCFESFQGAQVIFLALSCCGSLLLLFHAALGPPLCLHEPSPFVTNIAFLLMFACFLYFVSHYVINRTIPFSCADIKNINSRDRVNIIIWNDKQNNYMFLLSKSKIYCLAEDRYHLAFARRFLFE